MVTQLPKTVTEPQLKLLKTLADEINLIGTPRDIVKANQTVAFASEYAGNPDRFSRRDASNLIDVMLKVVHLRRAERAAAPPPVPSDVPAVPGKSKTLFDIPVEEALGAYRYHDTNYQVKKSQGIDGRIYAREIIPPRLDPLTGTPVKDYTGKPTKCTFRYARGVIFKLTPAMKLTIDDAEKFGALYNQCIVCGRTLSAKTSVLAGIGPVCASRLHGAIPAI